MRLVDAEKRLESLIDANINDPNVFIEILKLYKYFIRYRWGFKEQLIEEIATKLAEDTYIRILNGKHIEDWLGYIEACRPYCFFYAKKICSSQIIDTQSDDELDQVLKSIGGINVDDGSAIYKEINCLSFIDNLSDIIDKILSQSNYFDFTSQHLNAKLSLTLSLCNKDFISYNQEESDRMYTNMLYHKLKDWVQKELHSDMDNFTNNLTLLQLYNLSNLDNIED